MKKLLRIVFVVRVGNDSNAKEHNRGIILVLAFPTLLRKTTPEEVAAAFDRVKVADVAQWTKTHLNTTVTALRQRVYGEAKGAKTTNSATPVVMAT